MCIYMYTYISADPSQLQGERAREKVSFRVACKGFCRAPPAKSFPGALGTLR